MVQEMQPENKVRKHFCLKLDVLDRDMWGKKPTTTEEHQPKLNH